MAEIKVDAKGKRIKTELTTCKGTVIGFSAITSPSTKFNPDGQYSISILIPKKEGEEMLKQFQEIKRQQYKTFGKSSTAQEISRLKPYVVVVKNDDGEIVSETPDEEGRFILKATEKATIRCKNGEVINKKIKVFDAKGKPCNDLKIGEGSVVRLAIDVAGYTVAGKTGISVGLKAVQVIEYIEYGEGGTAENFGFEVEEGFETKDEEGFKETVKEEDDDITEDEIGF